MRAIGTALAFAAIVLTGCKSVETTEPGVVGVERKQNMLVSSKAVNSSAETQLPQAHRRGRRQGPAEP